MYGGADESESERYLLRVDQIETVASKHAVWLVSHDEDYVGGYAVGALVALLLEGDARARAPPTLHRDRQDLLAKRGRVAVVVHDTTRNFHFLDAAVVDFFEREHEVALDRRVLLLFAAARQTAKVVRLVELSVHVKVRKRIVAAKELVKDLVRIATKRVRLTPVAILVKRHSTLKTLFAKLVVDGFALIFILRNIFFLEREISMCLSFIIASHMIDYKFDFWRRTIS